MTTKEMTEAEAYESHNRTIVASDGETIGTVREIYLHDRTQKPEWVTVAGGAFGGMRFVPLVGAVSDGDVIRARVTIKQVQDAPSVDPAGHLSELEEARLFEHYGIPHANYGLTPVVGSVRTTRWTTADDLAGRDEPAVETTGAARGQR